MHNCMLRLPTVIDTRREGECKSKNDGRGIHREEQIVSPCLGIPSSRVKLIFDFADHLLRSATASIVGEDQSLIPRLLLQRIHVAWHLLAACCSPGPAYLRSFLPRLNTLWRHVFPRSQADFEQEQQRGDSFTWTLSFNQRSGALGSMASFLSVCPLSEKNARIDDVTQRILTTLDTAVLMLRHVPNLIKHFGSPLRTPTTLFRLRLYQLLLLIPVRFYEQHRTVLIRELVAEFTLNDNPSATSTSLLRVACHDDECSLLGKRQWRWMCM